MSNDFTRGEGGYTSTTEQIAELETLKVSFDGIQGDFGQSDTQIGSVTHF